MNICLKKKCAKYSLNYSINLTTNGLINRSQIEYLKKYNIFTTISMDCCTETLNKLRPMRNNNNTLHALMRTLEIFETISCDFGIRSTISEVNVNEMQDFVRFLSKYKSCKGVHFQPLNLKGRAANKEQKDIFYENYIVNFNNAKEEGYRCNIDVSYSGSQINSQRDTFCSALGKNLNFCVSTTGIVSSCYEHLDENEDDPFIYGKYNFEGFVINREKYMRLKENYLHSEKCKDCFLFSTCKGDCCSGCSSNEMRCYINRDIAKRDLFILSLSEFFKEEQTNRRLNKRGKDDKIV